MSKYSILLFDADATLMDFHRSEHEAVKECLEFFSLPSDESVIAKYSEINAGYWKMLERGEIEKEKNFDLLNDFPNIKKYMDKATSTSAYAYMNNIKFCTEKGYVCVTFYAYAGSSILPRAK